MINVTNLSYTYPKNPEPTVKSIDFEIAEGEVFGFLGPSGAGKSTTQKILIKLLSNFEGEIQISGKKLKDWSSEFYNHIGVGFELPNHYLKLTALENLKFFSTFYAGKTPDFLSLLEMVGLVEDANKKVENYSKGMKMRLNFIRALLHDPEIYFFDEPTTGLDPVNARNIKNIILDLKAKSKTIFITTHNMHDADELCDSIAFIVDGEIKLIDSPHDLKLQNGKRKLKVEFLTSGGENEKYETQQAEFELDGLGKNDGFIQLINNQRIQSMHSEEATLEDIFIKVTGRSLT